VGSWSLIPPESSGNRCTKQTSKSFCPRGEEAEVVIPTHYQLFVEGCWVRSRGINSLEPLTFPKQGQSRLCDGERAAR